jgi:hypothetical protein
MMKGPNSTWTLALEILDLVHTHLGLESESLERSFGLREKLQSRNSTLSSEIYRYQQLARSIAVHTAYLGSKGLPLSFRKAEESDDLPRPGIFYLPNRYQDTGEQQTWLWDDIRE